jgi:hypothetical protein
VCLDPFRTISAIAWLSASLCICNSKCQFTKSCSHIICLLLSLENYLHKHYYWIYSLTLTISRSGFAGSTFRVCRFHPPHLQVSPSAFAGFTLCVCRFHPPRLQVSVHAKIDLQVFRFSKIDLQVFNT